MTLRTLLELLTAWQFIFISIAVMLLLPLIFYLASLKPPRRLTLSDLHRDKKKTGPRPAREQPRPEDESREQRGNRSRKAIEDGDEIEYEDRK
jgi:hypothetical protein